MDNIRCCFTGHRPSRLPWGSSEEDYRCTRFKELMVREITTLYQQGVRHFITGMALGADLYFGETVLSLRQQWEDISLECAIPCRNQTRNWSESQIQRYHNLLQRSQYETLIQEHYSHDCMMRRNRYMVNHSQYLIAGYDGSPKGGTARTIAYAMEKGLDLIILPLTGKEYL